MTGNETLYPSIDLSDGHLLIIDDQETIRKRIRATLETSSSFSRFTEACDGLEGFQKLLQKVDDIDVIVCDVEMPQIDGFKFLNLKASKPELEEIPVIMLTTRGELENRLRGLTMGASDYVIKPFEADELVARTTVQLRVKRLLDALRRQAHQLQQLSITDPLTRVYNRRYLMEQLEKEFSRAKRNNADLTLVLGDIDYFKKINDSYGHQVGDSVLIDVAQLLGAGARQHDILARYGGEEFCLVLPDTDMESGLQVAERCRTSIEARRFRFGTDTLEVRMSFGVASIEANRAKDIEDLIRFADVALYRAKDGGRNRTIQYQG